MVDENPGCYHTAPYISLNNINNHKNIDGKIYLKKNTLCACVYSVCACASELKMKPVMQFYRVGTSERITWNGKTDEGSLVTRRYVLAYFSSDGEEIGDILTRTGEPITLENEVDIRDWVCRLLPDEDGFPELVFKKVFEDQEDEVSVDDFARYIT